MLVVALSGCGSAETPPLPSIVLVTLDTTRADHLGCYGYFRDTSPRLDAFAAEALLFERAVAPMATTLPSHVSLLSSVYPLRHGIKSNYETWSAEVPYRSLAEMLRELGYGTAAFVSALPLEKHTGIGVGFDEFDEPPGSQPVRRAADTNSRVSEWLASDRPGPVFLWIHYFDPHFPYDPPAPFDSAFTTDDRLMTWLREKRVPRWRMDQAPGHHNAYDGELLYLDTRLGELFDELRRRGLWEDAAVVIAGDHGEGLWEHGYRDHGRIYNEQLFVPLIFKFPAGWGPVGVRSSRVASLVDVVPTLVGALDLPVSEEDRARFQGVDLLDERSEREFVLAERTWPPRRVWESGAKYALVGNRWKYVHFTEHPDRLHDLGADPLELRNVLLSEREVAARMLSHLETLLEEAARFAPPPPGEAPAEALEGLRALGYVD